MRKIGTVEEKLMRFSGNGASIFVSIVFFDNLRHWGEKWREIWLISID